MTLVEEHPRREPPASARPSETERVVGPTSRGGLAALVVGGAGCFGSATVWVLALVSGLVFASLARRAAAEEGDARDPLGAAMQLAFLAVLAAAAFDHRASVGPPPLQPIAIAGLLAIAGGLWLRRAAVTALGAQFTVRLRVTTDHTLVRSGPYRVLRHPNYTGLLLIALGTALALSSLLALVATLVLWLPAMIARTFQEEERLVRRFGTDYEAYARATWRLIPGLL